ncbi:hypothetical protein PVAP13_2KG150248 [Panicum virgatum]|uniref:Uncharacterized protein n=1 Tax=Panicum virgatum TaxID=38727 RepID=A0A8T0W6X0_PANVG|nr:hypothetical protein PVAP13_2KG150248 [Panicum virgatum]
MKTLRAQTVDDGQAPMPSAQVVFKVLSQNSSNNIFLKNAGLPTPSSKSSPSREAALQLRKKTAAAEEVLERTASLFDELQKQEQESHLML